MLERQAKTTGQKGTFVRLQGYPPSSPEMTSGTRKGNSSSRPYFFGNEYEREETEKVQ
jgi:hypothetical protein